jgi:hypothetical protein
MAELIGASGISQYEIKMHAKLLVSVNAGVNPWIIYFNTALQTVGIRQGGA